MTSPFDPKVPLYQGQALRSQQSSDVVFPSAPSAPSAPAAPQPGFHFLEAGGHAILAFARLFGAGSADAEEAQEQNPRRRPRARAARPGAGTCCRANRPPVVKK